MNFLFKKNKPEKKRGIVWYCGGSWEDWGPGNLEKGIPGSQQAVIFLSREWAKLGHSVKVYNRCGAQAGIHEGVEYIPFEKFDKDQQYDVLIVWREQGLSLLDHELKARKVCLELQDVPFHRRWFTESRLRQVDRIFVKSRFHRDAIIKDPKFKFIPRRKFAMIPNGISTENLPSGVSKQKSKLVYASNYHRGLEYMLKWGWPALKKAVPDAELHIFYGWDQHDSYRKSEKDIAWKQEMIRFMDQPGVRDHGRAGRERLLAEKAGAMIHYYGSVWPETDCISVRESASVGCLPVTTAYGPLGEKKYCVTVGGDPHVEKTQVKLAEKIVDLLKTPEKIEILARRAKREAMKDSWDRIAALWLKEFN